MVSNQPFTPELALDVLYQALAQEIGIAIPILDPSTATTIQGKVYEARRDIMDPRLDSLFTHLSEDGGILFIQKKEVELD